MRALFIVVRIAGAAPSPRRSSGSCVQSVGFWDSIGIADKTNLFVNFFSFFTIDSNVGTVIVFLIGAVLLIRGAGDDPLWFAVAARERDVATWRSPASSTTCCCAA